MQDESLELVKLDARLKELEQENHVLRRQLEKIGKLGGSGGGSGTNTPGGGGRLSPANLTTSDGIHKVRDGHFCPNKRNWCSCQTPGNSPHPVLCWVLVK